MTFCEIEKILKADRWVLVRAVGSELQYRKVGQPYFVIIPNNNEKELSISAIKSLENKTGLSLLR